MTINQDLIPSASVLLLRQGANAIETLLLKKNTNITFGGSWVFPGGRVDKEDYTHSMSTFATERKTAIRECNEEVGLTLDANYLLPLSRWITPTIRSKRFDTIFFVYDSPDPSALNKSIKIDHGEIVDAQWIDINSALSLHQSKQIRLTAPAFVTLHKLMHHHEVAEALKHRRHHNIDIFRPRIHLTESGPISLYEGDASYNLPESTNKTSKLSDFKLLERAEQQHRLYMFNQRPWIYVNSTQ